MVIYIAFLCLIAVSSAAPQYEEAYDSGHDIHHQLPEHKPHIPIIASKLETHKNGYEFSYKTGNGIHAEESGYLKKVPVDPKEIHHGDEHHDEAIVMHGKVSYTGADGVPITLTYIADENGFQPQGAHLPTPPPIPPEIQKALNLQGHHEIEHKDLGGHEYGAEDYGQYQTYQ